MRRIFACALFAFGIARSAIAQNTVRVDGTVRDAITTRPLAGVLVTLGVGPTARTTRSDESGSFGFQKVLPASYELSVRRLGYEAASLTIAVVGDTSVQVPLHRAVALDTMRIRAAPQAIFGVVASATDLRPLGRATVQVFGTSSGEVTTDSTGHFFYDLQTPGSYVVRARAQNFGSQTLSVTVGKSGAAEVALLLDSASGPSESMLEQAYGDFRSRLMRRDYQSALIPRSDLLSHADRGLLASIMDSRSFGTRGLRVSEAACLFVDGVPRPGFPIEAIDPQDVEAVEVYSSTSDRSRTLAERWPKGMPVPATCGSTGMPRLNESGGYSPGAPRQPTDIVRWVVVWLKH